MYVIYEMTQNLATRDKQLVSKLTFLSKSFSVANEQNEK